MYTLKLTKPMGRTGNTLLCIINAIIFARKNNINKIDFTTLGWWSDQLLPNGKNELINKLVISIDNEEIEKKDAANENEKRKNIQSNKPSLSWNIKTNMFESWFLGFYIPIGTFEERTEVAKKYIIPIMNIPLPKCTPSSNDLVIHLRSGDIMNKGHGAYIQPPLSYYIKIIESRKWDKIYIITEHTNNPCLQKLTSSYNNVISFADNKKERHGGNGFGFAHDLGYLVNCKNYVACQSSLAPLIIQLNKNIENVYIPSYILKTKGQNTIRETGIWWTKNLCDKTANFKIDNINYNVLDNNSYIELPDKIFNYQDPKWKNYLLEWK